LYLQIPEGKGVRKGKGSKRSAAVLDLHWPVGRKLRHFRKLAALLGKELNEGEGATKSESREKVGMGSNGST